MERPRKGGARKGSGRRRHSRVRGAEGQEQEEPGPPSHSTAAHALSFSREEGWGGEGPPLSPPPQGCPPTFLESGGAEEDTLPATRLTDEGAAYSLYANGGAGGGDVGSGYEGYGGYGGVSLSGAATTTALLSAVPAPSRRSGGVGEAPVGGAARKGRSAPPRDGGPTPPDVVDLWELYDFHAIAVKGYPLKIFLDILATSYACIDLRLLADGITLREAVKETKSIAHEAFVERCQLEGYHVVEGGMCVSFDVQALQKRLKNVRKKDTLTFQIRRNQPEKLFVTISQPSPASGEGGGMAADSEEVFVRITRRDMALPMVDLPEDVDYHQPIVIGARRFQRVKRQIASQREVRIQMNGNRFLSISAHDGDASGATLNFGMLPPGTPPTYSRIFSKKQMIQIIKLPGMTSVNMAFREPKVRDYPLMASADIGRFGSLRVYIQDKTAIERAESQQWQQDVI